MNLGEWKKACVKSVLYPLIPILVYFLVMAVFEDSNIDPHMYFIVSLMFTATYILFSTLGWFFIGLPTHWIATNYFNQNIIVYLVSILMFSIALIGFTGLIGALLYGGVAVVQMVLFLFVKKHNKPLKRD